MHVLVQTGGEEYNDAEAFPGAESTRTLTGMSQDTLSLLQLGLAVLVGPVLLSAILRVAIIDPLLHGAEQDLNSYMELSDDKLKEIAVKVEATERRLKYEIRMGRAPKLSDAAMEARSHAPTFLLPYAARCHPRGGASASKRCSEQRTTAGKQCHLKKYDPAARRAGPAA